MFNSLSKSCLGIDIGTGQVKIVELQKGKNNYELKNYAIWNLAVDGDDVIQASSLNMLEEDVANHIKKLMKFAGLNAKEAVMSLPAFSTFVTVMELPVMPVSELGKAIEFEARHYIPVPLKEVHLDWTIIKDKKVERLDTANKDTSSIARQEILIAAVSNDLLNKYENIAKKVGVKLRALELETFALGRVLASNIAESVLIMDLGKRSSSLNIVEKGIVFLSRNLDTGGNEVSRAIAGSLGVNFSRAEEIKKTIGMNGDSNIKKVISLTLDVIINEAERLIDTYYQKYQKKPRKVILAGGLSGIKGLKEYLEENLHLDKEIIIGNPWKNISYPQILEPALRELAPVLTIAVGLAMREDI